VSDLGPRLVREGLIAREDLALALQAQSREGRTVTYHLLAIGAIHEDALVRYFCTRFPVEELRPDQVERIDPGVLSLVPGPMAGEFRVLPVGRQANVLTLAMGDPSDTHALDEVRFYTGCQVVPFALRESILTRALERCYGVVDAVAASAMRISGAPPGDEPVVELTRRSGALRTTDRNWTNDGGRLDEDNVVLLTKKRPGAALLPEAPEEERERQDTVQDLSAAILAASELAWDANPDDEAGRLDVLAPMVRGRMDTAPLPAAPEPPAAVPGPVSPFPPAMDPPPRRRTIPITPQPMVAVRPPATAPPAPAPVVAVPPPPSLDAIHAAPDRDQAILRALEALCARTQRALFFVVKRGVAEGWDAHGGGLTRERVRNLWVPLSSPSVLKDVVATRSTFLGPAPDTLSNGMLLAALGGRPESVLLCPVLVRAMPAGVLYADGLREGADESFAQSVATALGAAMERLILLQKQAKATP